MKNITETGEKLGNLSRQTCLPLSQGARRNSVSVKGRLGHILGIFIATGISKEFYYYTSLSKVKYYSDIFRSSPDLAEVLAGQVFAVVDAAVVPDEFLLRHLLLDLKI